MSFLQEVAILNNLRAITVAWDGPEFTSEIARPEKLRRTSEELRTLQLGPRPLDR